MDSLNLLRLFGFYLMAMFLIGTWRRLGQYADIARLIASGARRWPKLVKVVSTQRALILQGPVLYPASISLLLTATHMFCTRIVWPKAYLTIEMVSGEWWLWPFLLLVGGPMLAVDCYFILAVGRLDRTDIERQLDQAEHWLTTWKAPVLTALTFGWVNPRRIVSNEVTAGLAVLGDVLGQNFRWLARQAALRIAFGLVLWFGWAFA